MITFSNKVKNEICNIDFEDDFNDSIFLLFYFNNSQIKIDKNNFYLLINNKNILFLLKDKIKKEIKDLKIKTSVSKNNEKSKLYFNRLFVEDIDFKKINIDDDAINRSIIIGAFLSNADIAI